MKYKLFKSIEYKIAIRKHNNDFLFENIENIKSFKIFKNDFFHWYADPFIKTINEKSYIFAECLNRFLNKGHIVYAEINDNKLKWHKLIKEKYHLSFPNIYNQENKLVIMPESGESSKLTLYYFSNFNEITKKETLIDNEILYDSVLFKNLIFSYDENCNCNSLKIYKKNKESKYELFQTIPDDNHILRPAGQSFTYLKEEIIPTQKSISYYGEGIIFNKIEKYSFKPFLSINYDFLQNKIDKKIIGIHTYNKNEKYEVIDFLYSSFNLISFLGKFFVFYRFIKKKLMKLKK